MSRLAGCFHLGPVLFIPAVGVLGGQAQESRDSTGFDFVVSPGVIGHTPRYSYSSSATGGWKRRDHGGGSYLSNDRIPRGGIGVVVSPVRRSRMIARAQFVGAGLSLRVRQ